MDMKAFSGLPRQAGTENTVASSFACIAEAFALDLRSQQQVFRHSEAAAAGLPNEAPLHCFFLFFLAAILHRDRRTFENICQADGAGTLPLQLTGVLSGFGFSDPSIPYSFIESGRGRVSKSVQGSVVFSVYRKLATESLSKIFAKVQNEDQEGSYPNSIAADVASEMEMNIGRSRDSLPSIAKYPSLLRSAGQIQ